MRALSSTEMLRRIGDAAQQVAKPEASASGPAAGGELVGDPAHAAEPPLDASADR